MTLRFTPQKPEPGSPEPVQPERAPNIRGNPDPAQRPPLSPERPYAGLKEAASQFCRAMKISSKEEGVVPFRLNRPQQIVMDRLFSALDRDVHNFLILKPRQVGISTISLAIDLFWLIYFDGMQAALVADREDNKEKFRAILKQFLATLAPEWPATVTAHNKSLMSLGNGSILDYLTAGAQRSADLGTSRALTMVHATEVAKWAGAGGVGSLLAAMAERNPRRLAVWESTANGFNHWADMWEAAKADPSAETIFLAWWMHDAYSIPRTDPRYRAYWDGSFSTEEQRLVGLVLAEHRRKITPPQLAWWRWKSDTWQGDVPIEQEYPWTETEAFVGSGASFFPSRAVVDAARTIETSGAPFRGYFYEFAEDFESTRINVADNPEAATLRVWEEPVAGARYAIGIDPAYGRNDAGDLHAITVLRCYADRTVQAAAYATNQPDTYQLSWVLAHLAGLYRDCMVNLEIGGPGAAVMASLKALRDGLRARIAAPPSAEAPISDPTSSMRWYLYHRPDTFGSGYVLAWKTSVDTKQEILLQMRDAFQLGQLEVRDAGLIAEMKKLIRLNQRIMADSGATDDRIMATAFALRCWIDWLRGPLVRKGLTFEREHAKIPDRAQMVSHVISEYFATQRSARRAAAYEAL